MSSVRNTILEQLKDDLQDYVKSSRSPYKSDIAEVKRGIYNFDMIVNKPCVCFSLETDEVDEELFAEVGTDQVRILKVYLYGYMDSDGLGNYDDLHQLVYDIEYFIKYNFTYNNRTYVKDIGIIEGGASAPCSFFDMYLEIQYVQEL